MVMATTGGHRAARGRGVLRKAVAVAAHEATFLSLVRLMVAVDSSPVRLLFATYGAGAREAKGADPGIVDAAPGGRRAWA